jgi:tripartite-type tricarboxylate transporter receptor subunit TctC
MSKLKRFIARARHAARGYLKTIAAGVLLGAAALAGGQSYPNRPVRIVTGAPGSGAEFAARVLAQGLAAPLGQPVIVEPRATGGATVFGEIVARAQPDGYTVMIIGATLWIGPLFRKTPYDALKDFAPISLLAESPNILVVAPGLTIHSVRDLIELAKAKPGSLNYSTSGIGASPHLSAELFKTMARVEISHIPFKGAGAAVIGVLSGEVQLSFASAASVSAHVQSGRLKAIAVTSAKPSALFPDLPTVGATIPGYEVGGATGFFAPANTPAPVVARLNREAAALLARPDVREKFLATGLEPVASAPGVLAATLKSETVKWGKVIKEAKIVIQ